MGIGAYEGFVATTTGILATTTTWESTSGLITYYVVDNAGLAVDWVALGGGVAVSIGVQTLAVSGVAVIGVAIGSFLEALGEATYDAFTWNGHVYE